MMLARVADSLYWIGRYVERAEHFSRLADVMLNATLDQSDAGGQAAFIALTAVSDEPDLGRSPYDAAKALMFDREDANSVVMSLARARENARQVRDQITTETWERLNMLFLRTGADNAERNFDSGPSVFLRDIIADLHLFKGAADGTMSHGEGWSFLLLGVYLERAQLIGSLLEVCFGETRRWHGYSSCEQWRQVSAVQALIGSQTSIVPRPVRGSNREYSSKSGASACSWPEDGSHLFQIV